MRCAFVFGINLRVPSLINDDHAVLLKRMRDCETGTGASPGLDLRVGQARVELEPRALRHIWARARAVGFGCRVDELRGRIVVGEGNRMIDLALSDFTWADETGEVRYARAAAGKVCRRYATPLGVVVIAIAGAPGAVGVWHCLREAPLVAGLAVPDHNLAVAAGRRRCAGWDRYLHGTFQVGQLRSIVGDIRERAAEIDLSQ